MSGWTQADLDALEKRRSAESALRYKPVVRVELGEWVSESFFVAGSIPSKKNRKRAIIKQTVNGPTPGLITDGEVHKQLAALTNQCAVIWSGLKHRWPLTNATVELLFCPSHMRQDLDNAAGALMDSLVAAGVLRTDSMTHVKELHLSFQTADPGKEGAWITVKGREYIERVVGRKAA